MRGVAGVFAAALLVLSCTGNTPAATPTSRSTSAVPCGPSERFERHAHAHLTIVVRGQLRPVPANIGIAASTICWLHTHDASGIIHIEAGDDRAFTLGDLFGVWGKPLSRTQLVDERVGTGESIQATENQKPFTEAPETIVLDDLDDIVLELGPPFPAVPPYVWPPGY